MSGTPTFDIKKSTKRAEFMTAPRLRAGGASNDARFVYTIWNSNLCDLKFNPKTDQDHIDSSRHIVKSDSQSGVKTNFN